MILGRRAEYHLTRLCFLDNANTPAFRRDFLIEAQARLSPDAGDSLRRAAVLTMVLGSD